MNDPNKPQSNRTPLEHKRMTTERASHKLALPRPHRLSLASILTNSPRVSTTIISRPLNVFQQSNSRIEDSSSPIKTSPVSSNYAHAQLPEAGLINPAGSYDLRPPNLQNAPHIYANSSRSCEQLPVESEEYQLDFVWQHMKSTSIKIQHLSAQNEHLSSINSRTSRELEDCRTRLNVVSKEAESASSELRQIRPALANARENLASKEAELVALNATFSHQKSEIRTELSILKEQNNQLTDELNQYKRTNDSLRKAVEIAKSGIANLSEDYSGLNAAFLDLKNAYNLSQHQLRDMMSEAKETRKLAETGLSRLLPILDEENNLARIADTKAVIKELQDDLTSSQQVTSLLRDKLHNMGYQLADSQAQVRELETEKRGALQELLLAQQEEKREFGLLLSVQENIHTLSTKLFTREQETMDILAEATITRAQLTAATNQIDEYRKVHDDHTFELKTLKLAKEEHISKLLALQDIINARDKEIISLKSEVKALNESKAELRALLAEAKKDLAQKAMELQARDPNEELLSKVSVLEGTNAFLSTQLQEAHEKNTASQNALKTLEVELREDIRTLEKTNVQLISSNTELKSSISHLEKVQDQLKVSEHELLHRNRTLEKSYAELSSSNTVINDLLAKADRDLKASIPITVLETRLQQAKDQAKEELDKQVIRAEEAYDGLFHECADLKKRLEVQSLSLFQSKEECSVLKERISFVDRQFTTLQETYKKQEETHRTLVHSLEKRGSLAENGAQLVQERFYLANQTIDTMKAQIVDLSKELQSSQEKFLALQNTSISESEQQLKKHGEIIEELRSKNAQLSRHADEIVVRYKNKTLTNAERIFVAHLMDESRRIHEEDVVRKDNELRRRQHMVDSQNAKITELQGTLARLLKEKIAPVGKAQEVVFKAYLPSSPNNAQSDAPHGGEGGSSAIVAFADSRHSIGHSKPLTINTNPNLQQTSELDSEDDIPLSELSRLEGNQSAGNKRTRSRSPPSADEPILSKRRAKTTVTTQPIYPQDNLSVVKRKVAENGAKSKQKKRK